MQPYQQKCLWKNMKKVLCIFRSLLLVDIKDNQLLIFVLNETYILCLLL